MNYLIISPNGLSFFTVPRLNAVAEVEKIYYCYPNLEYKHNGAGLNELPEYSKLEMIQDYNYALNKHKPGELVVVIDDVGIGETGKAIRDLGYRVVGGGVLADKLERERTFATNLMKKVMDVPETFDFSSFEEGKNFLKTQEKTERFVFKPNDEDTPKEYTFLAKDIPDMIESMAQFKEEWKWKESFQLQRFVKGIETDFSGYFDGEKFLPNSMMIYFENKAVMNDDVGPSGGGSIAVEFARPISGLFGDILKKMIPVLKKDGYKGQMAINSIVSEEDHKPYFLEFSNRFGYPSFQIDITLIEAKGKTVHDLYMALANGTNADVFKTNRAAVVVSVGVPPYPSKESVASVKGLPMKWDKKYDDYFFPSFIMKDDKKGIVLAGISAECLQVTCEAENVDGATQMLYETYLPSLRLKGAMYRTDCGVSAKKRLKAIKDWGLF